MLSCSKKTLGLLVVFYIFFYFSKTQDSFAYFQSDGAALKSIGASQDCTMASEDSLGFFDDIPNALWQHMKNVCLGRHYRNQNEATDPVAGMTPQKWYTNYWDPDFSCPTEDKIGSMGDGHKWVCDPHRVEIQSKLRWQAGQKGCIVYSIGSDGDFTFEQDVLRVMPSCEIHTFDFFDYTEKIPVGLKIQFHAWGLKASTDAAETRPNYKTIEQTVRELGHEHQVIDIFKIDCEGCEWNSYKDWISNDRIDIRQILIEVHHIPPMVNTFFQDISNANYVIFHKEANILATGTCIEYGFLKMGSNFFNKAS